MPKKTKKEIKKITEDNKMEINPLLKDIEPEIIKSEKEKLKINFSNHLHEFRTAEVIFVVLITLIIGFCSGYFTSTVTTEETKNLTVENTDDKDFNKIIKTYNYMIKEYVDNIDGKDLIDGAIEGMLEVTNDPYTSYYDQDQTSTFYKELKGTFYGIGCVIAKSGNTIYVLSTLEDSPARDSGVLANDIIKEVNGTITEGLTTAEVVELIEQSKKEIEMKISRNGILKTININKAMVTIKSIESSIFEKNNQKIGYLKINLFAANTDEQFEEELKELESDNIDSLIIDVRNNSGGYLTSVTNIASLFFDKSTTIYQLQTKTEKIKKYALTNDTRKYDVVILQNNASASGSEILAGVFKEIYGSEIIGTNSYGKSSVQQTVDLGDGTMFKYTTQQWLTALGNNIGGFGLEPTIELEQGNSYYEDMTNENDVQLQKAIEVLAE